MRRIYEQNTISHTCYTVKCRSNGRSLVYNINGNGTYLGVKMNNILAIGGMILGALCLWGSLTPPDAYGIVGSLIFFGLGYALYTEVKYNKEIE
jgi:hypothetical protein